MPKSLFPLSKFQSVRFLLSLHSFVHLFFVHVVLFRIVVNSNARNNLHSPQKPIKLKRKSLMFHFCYLNVCTFHCYYRDNCTDFTWNVSISTAQPSDKCMNEQERERKRVNKIRSHFHFGKKCGKIKRNSFWKIWVKIRLHVAIQQVINFDNKFILSTNVNRLFFVVFMRHITFFCSGSKL